MKIQLHHTAIDGKPEPGTGKIIEGSDAREVVEIMRYETPFTADQPFNVYMESLLAKLDKTVPPLPSNDPEAAATEFLSRLAASGHISFK